MAFTSTLFEPAHEIMVLITQETSKGSGKTARIARAFAVRAHEVWKKRSDQKSDI